MNDLREQVAELAHQQWTGWMSYLFGQCQRLEAGDFEGGLAIPRVWYERWKRQMATPYADLSEAEKDSDRHEADRVLAVFIGRPANGVIDLTGQPPLPPDHPHRGGGL